MYKNFKMIFDTVQSFHNKSFFYSLNGYKKFLVMQSYFPITTKLNKINIKLKANSISTFDFSTLYTTIPHKLLKVLLEVINFIFKSEVRIGFSKHICFSKTSIYSTFKGSGRRYFTKQTLVSAMSFLINKCFFNVGNIVFLNKNIGIHMDIDPDHFGSTSFFIFFILIIENNSFQMDLLKHINIKGFIALLITFMLQTMTISF